MSNDSIKLINKWFKGGMTILAIVIAVGALFYNPGHLFSAALVWAFGHECEITYNEE